MMTRINDKIVITNLIPNSNRTFSNDEINSFVNHRFKCTTCNCENEFNITPYETGFGFLEIYENGKILTKDEVIKNKIATQTSPWASYLGELTVNDLATLYLSVACKNCKSNYLIVFSFGEKQPGLTLLEISGVWQYKTVKAI